MNRKLEWLCYEFMYDSAQIFFFDSNNNVYAKKNLMDGNCKVESTLELDDKADRRFSAIARYNDNILFAPGTESYLLVYNEVEKTTRKILLDEEKITSNENRYKFGRIIVWNKKVFLFPHCAIAIVIIDLETSEVEYFEEWYKKSKIKYGEWVFKNIGCQIKEKYYLPFFKENKILCFNMDSNQWEIYEIPNCEDGFWCMEYDGENIWLAAMEKNYLYKWDMCTDNVEKIELDPTIYEEMGGSSQIISKGEYILLCPFRGNEICIFNKISKSIIRKIQLPVYNNLFRYFSYIIIVDENYLLGFADEVKKLLKISIDTGKIEEYDNYYSEEGEYNILNTRYKQMILEKKYEENSLIDLNFFIKKINMEDVVKYNDENQEEKKTFLLF